MGCFDSGISSWSWLVFSQVSYLYNEKAFAISAWDRATKFFAVFQPLVWLALAVVTFIPLATLTFHESYSRRSSFLKRSMKEAWHWIGVVFGQPTLDLPIRINTGSRMLSALLAFVILFSFAMYENTLLTGLLVSPKPKTLNDFKSVVQSLEDNNARLYAGTGTVVEMNVKDPQGDKLYQRLHTRYKNRKVEILSPEKAVNKLSKDSSPKSIFMSTSIPMAMRMVSGYCGIRMNIFSESQLAYNTHLIYKKYHPTVEMLKAEIIRQEWLADYADKMHLRHLRNISKCSNFKHGDQPQNLLRFRQLNIDVFIGPLLLLMIGAGISVLFAVCEKCLARVHFRRKLSMWYDYESWLTRESSLTFGKFYMYSLKHSNGNHSFNGRTLWRLERCSAFARLCSCRPELLLHRWNHPLFIQLSLLALQEGLELQNCKSIWLIGNWKVTRK